MHGKLPCIHVSILFQKIFKSEDENESKNQNVRLILSSNNTDNILNDTIPTKDPNSDNNTLKIPSIDLIKDMNKYVLEAIENVTGPIDVTEEHSDKIQQKGDKNEFSSRSTESVTPTTESRIPLYENKIELENTTLEPKYNTKFSNGTYSKEISETSPNNKDGDEKVNKTYFLCAYVHYQFFSFEIQKLLQRK